MDKYKQQRQLVLSFTGHFFTEHWPIPWPSAALCSTRAEKERNGGGLTGRAQSFGSGIWLGDRRGAVMADVGLDEVVAG
jgi:hypothetical protein